MGITANFRAVMLTRRDFLDHTRRLLKGSVVLGAACGAEAYFHERHQVVTVPHRLPMRGLGTAWQGTRIVQLSDLHLEPFTTEADIAQAVRMANALQPDLILITGDFVTKEHSAAEKLGELLSDLRAPLGIYGCLGNHDHWHEPEFVQQKLEAKGIGILRNESLILEKQGQRLCLAGLDSAWAGVPMLAHALRKRPPGDPVLLMIHEPDYVRTTSQDARVVAQLSGHTHGGQARVPGFSPPFLPALGKRYAAGAYEVGRTHLYVNRGIGCIGLPLRFASPPEVTLHLVETV